jgi:hypothetical protein
VLALILLFGFLERSGSTAPGLGAVRAGSASMLWTFAWIAGLALGGTLVTLGTAGIGWITMRLLGGRPPWGRTWASYAYGTAPWLVVALPFIGIYCAGWAVAIWAMVATGFVLASATREPVWRVVCALLAPPLLAAAAVAALVLLTMSTSVAWSTASGPPAPVAGTAGQAADPSAVPQEDPE